MKRKTDLPTVEKMSSMGFQDGYCGAKSKADEYLARFANKKINVEQIKIRILSYELGYKKGAYTNFTNLNDIKVIKGEIAINGHPAELSEIETESINNKIQELTKGKTKKRGEINENI